MQNINISVDLLNQIMSYLGTRPYQEVFNLIHAVQDLAKNQATAPAEAQPAPDQ